MNINVRVVIEEEHGLGVERVEIELSDLATRGGVGAAGSFLSECVNALRVPPARAEHPRGVTPSASPQGPERAARRPVYGF